MCIFYIDLLTNSRQIYILLTDKFEVNITDLIQERLGNSIYTTILAQYTGFPEKLLQWYVNGRPVGPTNTVYDMKSDGLNSYLRFKHDVNRTYGTFMLKVNGTKWKDTLKLSHPQQISSIFESTKNSVKKVITKISHGSILSDVIADPDPQSDTSANQFLSHNTYKSTSRKFRPEVIRLGQDKTQKPKPKSHYVRQNSMSSSQANLAPKKDKYSDRKFLKEVIRLGRKRKQENTVNEWTHLPAHAKSLEKKTHKNIVQRKSILQTLSPDLSELKLN